jgi:hypothetical protein
MKSILPAPVLAVPVLAAQLLAGLLLAGCVAPIGPVEVTRFHDPARVTALARGTITISAAPGQDPESLELRSYQTAVGHELQRLGYQLAPAGSSGQLAQVTLERTLMQPERSRGPVSVGVGGSAGTFGSGVGLGIGIDLSGKPKEQVATRLSVSIRDAAAGQAVWEGPVIWEGRAEFTVSAASPMADTQLGAARLAQALFQNFPGNNGETIQIK